MNSWNEAKARIEHAPIFEPTEYRKTVDALPNKIVIEKAGKRQGLTGSRALSYSLCDDQSVATGSEDCHANIHAHPPPPPPAVSRRARAMRPAICARKVALDASIVVAGSLASRP